jgi:hypothetical protein
MKKENGVSLEILGLYQTVAIEPYELCFVQHEIILDYRKSTLMRPLKQLSA